MLDINMIGIMDEGKYYKSGTIYMTQDMLYKKKRHEFNKLPDFRKGLMQKLIDKLNILSDLSNELFRLYMSFEKEKMLYPKTYDFIYFILENINREIYFLSNAQQKANRYFIFEFFNPCDIHDGVLISPREERHKLYEELRELFSPNFENYKCFIPKFQRSISRDMIPTLNYIIRFFGCGTEENSLFLKKFYASKITIPNMGYFDALQNELATMFTVKCNEI